MEAQRNPAALLIEYLEAALELKVETSMIMVWCTIFECSPREPYKITRGLEYLMQLIDETEVLIKAHTPGSPDRHLRPLLTIRKLISEHDLASNWGSWKHRLDQGTMTALGFCDQILEIEYEKKYPGTPEEVYGLIEDLNALLEKCLDSEMSPDLKALFAKNLEALRGALISYRIGGADSVNQILEQFTGSIVIHRNQIKNGSAAASDLLTESATMMEKVATVVNKGKELAALAAPLTKYIAGVF